VPTLLFPNRQVWLPVAFVATMLPLLAAPAVTAHAQRVIRATDRITVAGRIRSIGPGRIEIEDESGKVRLCRIQQPGEDGLALQGAAVRFPAKIEVRGEQSPRVLTRGMLVEFDVKTGSSGRVREPVTTLRWLDGLEPTVEVLQQPQRRGQGGTYRIVAAVVQLRAGKLTVALPSNRAIRRSKLTVPLDENASVTVRLTDLKRVREGATVEQASLVKFDTGDWAVESIRILLPEASKVDTARSKRKRGGSPATAEDRYGYLSDQPSPPRDVRSSHFVLHTDLSDRQAKILLDRLETMYGLLARYFGSRPMRPIECYVVRDLSQWSSRLPEAGAAKIAARAGVTISTRLGKQTRAVVYACDKPGVVQHEAVHAFCAQTFGSTGPTWYAEGIAEVGNYWKNDNPQVDVPAVVITYLKTTQRKPLSQIVAPGQITGDSWQAYAWRWALCHLLMNNPNYAPRFRSLGVRLMRGEKGVSFESVYGPVASQLSFEYDWFTRHVDNGFRADLCAWDWKRRFRPISSKPLKVTIEARRGWQPSGGTVDAGRSYAYTATGTWKPDSGGAVPADGRPDGVGRLVGIILSDSGELSRPFDLGEQGRFRPPTSGKLYLRCRDDWTRIADNSGAIRVELVRSPSDSSPKPSPSPR